MIILHQPTAPPVWVDTRSRESRVFRPYMLCYVQPDGVAVQASARLTHTRKAVIRTARELAKAQKYELERLYVWDTSGPWVPSSPSHWTPISATDREQWHMSI